MARAGDQAGFGRHADMAFQHAELFGGAVRVVGALQAQDRHADAGQEFGDVEGAEARVQPGAVPAVERRIDVAVVAGEALAQVAFLIGLFDLPDGSDVEVFHEEMRGDHHQAEQALVLRGAGVDRGDGAAVGMADQDRLADAGGVQHAGEHLLGFLVHVGHRAGQGGRVRLAVAEPGVCEHAAAGGLGQALRDVAPQADAAQAFVQQHQRGRAVGWRAPPGGVQVAVVERDREPARIKLAPLGFYAAGTAFRCHARRRTTGHRRLSRNHAEDNRGVAGVSGSCHACCFPGAVGDTKMGGIFVYLQGRPTHIQGRTGQLHLPSRIRGARRSVRFGLRSSIQHGAHREPRRAPERLSRRGWPVPGLRPAMKHPLVRVMATRLRSGRTLRGSP